jgi:glycosyltransferase involved in cell wall biosynthesis
LVLAFVALGHFESKGLPLLLSSIATLKDGRLKLIVVGGRTHLVREYQKHCQSLGLLDQVTFVGMQADVRPYLWCADAFILPSEYESFSLVAFEAAAAGLPILATSLNGVEEFLQDGSNGFLLEHRVEQMVRVFSRLLSSDREDLRRMGERARRDVAGYSLENFVNRWREFYCKVACCRSRTERRSDDGAE